MIDFHTFESWSAKSSKLGFAEFVTLIEKQSLDLVQIWVVADRLLMPSLQDKVAEELDRFGANIEDNAIYHIKIWFNYTYEHTAAGSSLRELAAIICTKLSARHFIEQADDFPKNRFYWTWSFLCVGSMTVTTIMTRLVMIPPGTMRYAFRKRLRSLHPARSHTPMGEASSSDDSGF